MFIFLGCFRTHETKFTLAPENLLDVSYFEMFFEASLKMLPRVVGEDVSTVTKQPLDHGILFINPLHNPTFSKVGQHQDKFRKGNIA